jgi:hypothetical protein
MIILADQREAPPKGYTHHEVVSPRAVGPSGRTALHKKSKKKIKTLAQISAQNYIHPTTTFHHATHHVRSTTKPQKTPIFRKTPPKTAHQKKCTQNSLRRRFPSRASASL